MYRGGAEERGEDVLFRGGRLISIASRASKGKVRPRRWRLESRLPILFAVVRLVASSPPLAFVGFSEELAVRNVCSRFLSPFVGVILVVAVNLAGAPAQAAAPEIIKKQRLESGIERRVPWTTSKIQGTPEPPSPYRTENAFPKLKFFEPLVLDRLPGTDRMFVAERPGKIFSFVGDPAKAEKQLVVDVGRTVYGAVAHPQFAKNGFLYVASIVNAAEPTPDGSRVSRFSVKPGDPPQADPASEKVILTWPSGGHNGGCLQFGPDGFLYLATGDGSGIADQLATGQDVSDLLGSILRIDVDRVSSDRPYSIPADNPFVGREGARPEIYSYGHRQVWRFGFDAPTGRLWAGEVGQDLWEMVYIVQKGGNYGWSVKEGAHPFRPERKLGPSPILPPLVEHPHSDFRSITGGYVYRGSRLPELSGAYVYADYDTGKIWSLKYDGQQVSEHRELDDTQHRIVSFGVDHAGELYFLDFPGGGIHRLAKALPETQTLAPFPRKLSETGLFASTKENRPAAGVIPYSVNAELWSDGARKERFLALPGSEQIEFDGVNYPQPAPGADPGWKFPHDTVLVKTFALELEAGNPASARRLETRILHHKKMPGNEEYGDQFWRGYTYVWNDDQTDAELLDAGGLDRTFKIRDAAAPGGVREQKWHFPSRAECTLCHTMSAKYVLGVNTLQLNRDHDYSEAVANQLSTFNHLKLFTKPLPKKPAELPSLANYHDESLDLNLRARAYLHANCAHCHRKWGGGNADFQTLALLPLDETGTIGVRPGHGLFDLADAKLLVPGSPDRSLLAFRMTKTGLGRMPHVGSNVVDSTGAKLIRQWIESLRDDAGLKRPGVTPPR